MRDGKCPGRRLAITAALNPPAPVPQNTSGAGVPSATAHLPLYIAFNTPTSYAALAPPPESTKPTRSLAFRNTSSRRCHQKRSYAESDPFGAEEPACTVEQYSRDGKASSHKDLSTQINSTYKPYP